MAIDTGKGSINVNFDTDYSSEINSTKFLNEEPLANFYDSVSNGAITEAMDMGTFQDDYGNNVNIAVVNPSSALVENMQNIEDFEEARSLYGSVTKNLVDLSHYEDNSTLVLNGNTVQVIYSNEYLNTYLDEYLRALSPEEKSFFISSKGAELENVLRNAHTPRDKVAAIAEFFATSFPKVRYGPGMHARSSNNLFNSFNPDSLITSLCNGAPFDCSALVSVALASAGVNLSKFWSISGKNRSGVSLVADEIKLVDQPVSGNFSNYHLQEGDILTIERTNHVGIVMGVNKEKGEVYVLHSTGNDQVDGTSVIIMDEKTWKVKDFTNNYGKTGTDSYLNVGKVYFDNVAYLDSFL